MVVTKSTRLDDFLGKKYGLQDFKEFARKERRPENGKRTMKSRLSFELSWLAWLIWHLFHACEEEGWEVLRRGFGVRFTTCTNRNKCVNDRLG